MQYALIHDGRVHAEASEADHNLGIFDIRDVSAISGVTVGWLVSVDGAFTAPPNEPEILPVISRAQAKIQLLRTKGSAKDKTLLDDAAAAVSDAGGELAIWFADSPAWVCDNAYVVDLFGKLKVTDAKRADFFREAAKIAA